MFLCKVTHTWTSLNVLGICLSSVYSPMVEVLWLCDGVLEDTSPLVYQGKEQLALTLVSGRVNLPIGNNPSYQARTSDVKQQKVHKSTVFCHIHKAQLNRTTLAFFPRSRVRQWFAWVTGKQYVPNAKFPIPKATFIGTAININPCPATRVN